MAIDTTSMNKVEYLGSGYFSCDGQKMTFEDLVFQVQAQAVTTADKVFATKFSEIKERNDKITKINDMIQMLRKYQDGFDKDGKAIGHQLKNHPKPGDVSSTHIMLDSKDINQWWDVYYPELVKPGTITAPFETEWTFCAMSKKQLDTSLENAKTALEGLNSMNEMDMMKLNKLGNQRSSYVQMATSLLGTIKEAKSAAARM